jgi:hypothetical protein
VTTLNLVSEALRAPVALVDRMDRERTLAVDGPRLLAALFVGAALFGFVVGAERSLLQGTFAGLKMPVLLLGPILVVLPALPALWRTCGVEVSYERLAVAALVGTTRSAVLAAAAAPLWWLVAPFLDYWLGVLAFAGTVALLGLPGLWVVGEAVPTGGSHRAVARLGTIALLGLCTMQMGWMTRPFLVRPDGEVVLVRAVEEDVFQALETTARTSVDRRR